MIRNLICKFWLQFPTQKNYPFPVLSDAARENRPGVCVDLTTIESLIKAQSGIIVRGGYFFIF